MNGRRKGAGRDDELTWLDRGGAGAARAGGLRMLRFVRIRMTRLLAGHGRGVHAGLLEDAPPQPGRALVEHGEELDRQLVQEVQRHRLVHVGEPLLALPTQRDLLAGGDGS